MKFAVTLLVAIAAVVMRTRIASKLCRPAVESELDDIPAFAFEVHLDDRIDGHVFALEEIGNGVAIGAFEDAGDFAFGQVAEGALALDDFVVLSGVADLLYHVQRDGFGGDG